MAVEAVRRDLFVGGRGPGAEDAEFRIDLHGIGIDHHASVLAGKVEGVAGFAARRRPGNEDRLVPACHGSLPSDAFDIDSTNREFRLV
jgi:hypothetical protein